MKVYICECGCEVKGKEPLECPICKKRGRFSLTECQDPSVEDLKSSKLYEDSLKQLEIYEEGCPPKKMDPCAEDC